MKTSIHPFDKHLLSVYYVPGTVPGAGERAELEQRSTSSPVPYIPTGMASS